MGPLTPIQVQDASVGEVDGAGVGRASKVPFNPVAAVGVGTDLAIPSTTVMVHLGSINRKLVWLRKRQGVFSAAQGVGVGASRL